MNKPKPQQAGQRFARVRQRLAATRARIDQWFPDREFIMRSQGQVRFIRLAARTQKRAATGVAVLALAYVGSITTLALIRWHDSRDATALLSRQARVEKAESRVAAYRRNLDEVTSDLQRRQDFIEKVTQAHLGTLPRDSKDGETVTNSSSETGRTIDKVSAAVPEAGNLARMEARQLAFVESLTRYADRRATGGLAMMRHLGVDPRMVLGGVGSGEAGSSEVGRDAMGGPLFALATDADGSIDPRFARLGASLSRMSALERAMSRMPQVLPASADAVSSGFGYRSDPFTRHGSFHPGLDFRGPSGAPIYAAARGMVSFVGQRSGYGNCVEVTHGPGLVTRYAHMSAFRSHVGQQVAAGQTIGAIGSTGRSTGPHLHFEVRINGQPTNPRPFLEARSHVSSTIVSHSARAATHSGPDAAKVTGPTKGSK
ncbi:M23 family metallopeptidase [Sphingomonas sp. 8AM]|uniref:M23 family metallopeptidase n=1 Tax=Sphingomonas sp. 8AM TaxID=2653170 RepID=UPI002E2B41A7|nr:peptidoglycan DD-metalloendopeptidase family protein [Sphingomonas sp. 8AM]